MKKPQLGRAGAATKSRLLPAFIAGVVTEMFIAGILLAACALVYTVTELPFYLAKPIVTIILCIACFVGAFFMLQIHKKNGLLSGFVFGVGICILLAVASLLSQHWVFTSASILRCIGIVAAAMIGGAVGVQIKPKRKLK